MSFLKKQEVAVLFALLAKNVLCFVVMLKIVGEVTSEGL